MESTIKKTSKDALLTLRCCSWRTRPCPGPRPDPPLAPRWSRALRHRSFCLQPKYRTSESMWKGARVRVHGEI